MILVSRRHRFALVTVPKNACTTLRFWFDAVERGEPGELERVSGLPRTDIHKLCQRLYLGRAVPPGTPCFAVLRNPWTRAASAYFDLIVRRGWFRGVGIRSFGQFLAFLELQNVETELCDQHFRAQHSFVDGLAIERYLKVETLQADFDAMVERLGLPSLALPNWKQSRARHASYRGLLSPAEAQRLDTLYGRDAALGGYACPPEMVDPAKPAPAAAPGWIARARLFLGLRRLWHASGVAGALERRRIARTPVPASALADAAGMGG